MEKICIVKLRRKMDDAPNRVEAPAGRPLSGQGGMAAGPSFSVAGKESSGPQPAPQAEGEAGGAGYTAGSSVALKLTEEQAEALRSNPRLLPFLNGKNAEDWGTKAYPGEGVVIKFEFDAMPPLSLLKADEVGRMLRISRSYLNRIIQQGRLKSYKFGRVRRIQFGDVLSYLEDHREAADMAEPASNRGASRGEADRHDMIKEA